jgi:hypothetical protein
MASMLDGMFQSILSNVPGSQQNQAKQQNSLNMQNTDLVNQSVAFKLGQDKLQADANNQLIPLQLEASKTKLQDEIGKAQLSLFMQPYQKEMIKSTMADSVTYGSDVKTGLTGEPDIDAQIQRIQKNSQMAIALDPTKAGQQSADAARAISELRKAGQDRKDQKIADMVQRVGVTPIDSLLREADLKPGDPMLQFIKAIKTDNPNATNTEIQSKISRVFGMDAGSREKLNFQEKQLGAEQQKWLRDYQMHRDQMETSHQDRQAKMALDSQKHQENMAMHNTDKDRLEYQKQQGQEAKLDKRSNDAVTKSLDEIDKFNSDTKPRGAASSIAAVGSLNRITDGKPVTRDNVYEALSRNLKTPDAQVDAKQIQALNVVQSELSKAYANSGQKSVKDILGQERSSGILPLMGRKLDNWLFGDGSLILATKDEKMKFAQVISDLHDDIASKVARGQVEKSNIALTNPSIKPDHKAVLAQNIMESPNSMPQTKYNTAIKLAEDLSSRGLKPTPDDAIVLKAALDSLARPSNPQAVKMASDRALALYRKYINQIPQTGQQSPQGHGGVLVPPITGLSEDDQREMMRMNRVNRRGG